MMEEIPLAIVLGNGVVSGPANYGGEYHALIGERAVGIVAGGVAQEMAVAGRVREVILAVVLVHPRRLEETVRVACLERFAVLAEDDHAARCFCKLQYIVAHLNHEARERGHVGLGKKFAVACRLCAHVNETIVVAVLAVNRGIARCKRLPPLELSAPETAKIGVDGAVVVLEDAGIDGERATDGLRLRNEGSFGLVGNSHAKTEHAVVTLAGEYVVVFAVFLHYVAVPQLFFSPRHILHVEDYAMVVDLAGHRVAVNGESVVVLHLEVSAVVVLFGVSLPVVGRIDENLAVENMNGRVCHVVGREQISFLCHISK